MNNILFELSEVSIGYRKPLLPPISLTVCQGEFWGLVGPNGAGKTTLVKTLIGLQQPLSGKVSIRSGLQNFGYIPQRHTLNPDFPLTVADVVLMGCTPRLRLGRRPDQDDRARVELELERLDMKGKSQLSFSSLSGGEKQRVLMARALVADPQVLVLDEPTEGIDLAGETEILGFLRDLHQKRGKTILMIGHHMSGVLSVVDHLCLINQHSNRFEAGTTRDLLSEERLSQVFGRPVEIDTCQERSHVHVKESRHGS